MSLQRVRRVRIPAIGVALVETLQIVVALNIGQFNEFRQGRAGEVVVLVVDRFDPGAVHCDQFSVEQIELTAAQYELAKDRAKGVAVVAAEIGDRGPGIQLRWCS
jgi:hypothetical protein